MAVDPTRMTEEELRAHLRVWPIRWIPCLNMCGDMHEWQVDGIGGRCSLFCPKCEITVKAERAKAAAEVWSVPDYDAP